MYDLKEQSFDVLSQGIFKNPIIYGTHNSQVLDSVNLSSFLISGIRVDRPPHLII
jgi:hypothetical protein